MGTFGTRDNLEEVGVPMSAECPRSAHGADGTPPDTSTPPDGGLSAPTGAQETQESLTREEPPTRLPDRHLGHRSFAGRRWARLRSSEG